MREADIIMAKINGLHPDQQAHLRELIKLVLRCYGDDADSSGVLLLNTKDRVTALSINATDMETADTVFNGYHMMNLHAMQGAPAKEMMN